MDAWTITICDTEGTDSSSNVERAEDLSHEEGVVVTNRGEDFVRVEGEKEQLKLYIELLITNKLVNVVTEGGYEKAVTEDRYPEAVTKEPEYDKRDSVGGEA